MQLPRVLDVGEVIGHRPSRHILRDHLRSLKQEDLIGFYMAAQRFATDAKFGEEVDASLVPAAERLVAQYGGNKTVKKALKEGGAAKAVQHGRVSGVVFGQAQRAVLAEITRIYREYEESDEADELFNMLAVHIADGAGIDVSGLRRKAVPPADNDAEPAEDEATAAAPPAARAPLTLVVPGAGGDGALANESASLVPPPHTPRGGSVDLSGKQSSQLVEKIMSKRSCMRGSMENLQAAAAAGGGEKAGEQERAQAAPAKRGAPVIPAGNLVAKSGPGHRIAFKDVVYNPLGVEMLRTFMHTEHNEENLHFHLAVRAFRRRVQSREDMIREAEQLWSRFMDESSKEEVTISAAIKKALRKELDTNPSTTSFDSTDRSVVKTMLSDVFRRFSSSRLHSKYVARLEETMKELQRKAVVHRRTKSAQLSAAPRGAVSLEDVVMDQDLLGAYIQFCADEYSEEGILFWCAADEYLAASKAGDTPADALRALASEIEERHLVPHAPYELAVDGGARRRCSAAIADGTLDADLFRSLQEAVFQSLKGDSFPRFLESPAYRDVRHLPPSSNRGFFSCVSSCVKSS